MEKSFFKVLSEKYTEEDFVANLGVFFSSPSDYESAESFEEAQAATLSFLNDIYNMAQENYDE